MSRIDCFTKHAPDLEKSFKKMVDEGVPELEAAKKLVDERALEVSKELNDFKKSLDASGKKIKRNEYVPSDVSKEVEAKKADYQKQIDEIKNAQLDAIRDDKQKEQIKDLIKRSPNVPADKIAQSISKAAEIPIEEATKLVEEVRGKEPPKPPVEENVGTGEKKPPKENKAFATRMSENKGLSEDTRAGIKEAGLKYKPQGHDEAAKIAKAVIDEQGIDQAVLMARAMEFGGDINTLIQTTALSRLADMANAAEKSGDGSARLEYAKKTKEITLALDEFLRNQSGRGISALNWFYTKDPLGMQMVENEKRSGEFKKWSKRKEQSWKEFFDEMVKEPEFETIIKEQVKEGMKQERAESRKARIEKVDKFFDDAIGKFKDSGATYSVIIPPKVITTALEGMKKAYRAGEQVAEVIQKAIDYISEELGGATWDKEKFRKEWEERLKEGKEKKPLTDDELKTRLLNKFRNKLKGLSDKQKEEVVIRAHKQIIESGGLDFPEFRKIISDVTGIGEMTDAQATKFRELVEKTNQVDKAGERVRTERTQEARKAYRKSEIEAAVATKELARLFYDRPEITKRITSMMQLNTLGIAALVNNPIYNIINQSTLRFPAGIVKTVEERIIQGGAKIFGKEYVPEYNIASLRAQKEFFKKLGLGVKEAATQFATGLNRMDYTQKEVQGQQIRPFRAIKDLWQFFKGEKTLTGKQFIDKALQASPLGMNAEFVARTLNMGDKPQRFAAEGFQASGFANKLGLKDIDYDIFIDFPREEAFRLYKEKGLSDAEASRKADYIKETIIKDGERSTFQQDNFLNDLITRAFGGKSSEVGGIAKTLIISPYIKIPSNAYWSYYNIVNPEVALLQSMIYGAKAIAKTKGTKFFFDRYNSTAAKDIHEAKYWFAHAAVGMATRAVVGSLVAAGIYRSGNTDEDAKKEREGELNYEPQGTINVTRLAAWLRGEDPNEVKGGLTVLNKWLGHWGTVGNTVAHRLENMTPEQKENEDIYLNMILGNLSESGLKELEQGIFANSSSLIKALNGRGVDGFKYWGTNTINLFANIVHPATLAQISRAELPYYSKIKSDSFGQEIKNSMLQRSSVLRSLLDEYPPSKVGIWGDKLEKNDNVVMRLFGFSNTNEDNFAQPLYEDYKKTGDTKFFPPSVSPTLTNNKKDIKLNASQIEELETMVGQRRKALIAPFVNEMATINIDGKEFKYSQLSKEKKVKHLNKLYDDAREDALYIFKQKHSELFKN